jgi:hypothetical protein
VWEPEACANRRRRRACRRPMRRRIVVEAARDCSGGARESTMGACGSWWLRSPTGGGDLADGWRRPEQLASPLVATPVAMTPPLPPLSLSLLIRSFGLGC